MADGTRVTWTMLGADIHVVIRKYAASSQLDWQGGAGGVSAYHAWLLLPDPGGTRVITEETEHGPLPFFLRWYLRGALHDAHEHWLEGLEKVSASGPAPPPGEMPPRK
jgi:hypothetical protein